ncbi:MAG: hypothetical protein LBN27_13670, partial [Prevotellaceae bacterium]|nr:hypothetical protein [Prevotellaceae bacterium]
MNILQEIFASLKHNKLRTTLTGLAVAWGIFIFIVLLGAGNGLRNGVMSNFSGEVVNAGDLIAGRTSMPYKGLKSNREMKFSQKELEILEKQPETGKISGVVMTDQTVSYGSEYGS